NVSFAPLQADTLVLRQAELARLAGALVVFPTGNTGLEASGPGSDAALFVGAVDQDGVLAPFSTFGSFVDIAAPGVSIYTTRKDGQFGRSSGSSFAAPVVSGVAALVWSVNPDLRPATVRGILLSTATDLGTAGDDVRFGAGQVNALAAVQLAQVIEEQQDERAPTVAIRRPADGASVSGTINIEVEVTDDSDLADVTLALDGAALAIDASAPYTFILNTARYARGTHVLTVTATDVFGNAADLRISLSFDSDEDTQAPGVTMESPAAGGTVRGVITILAEATDDRALSRGEVLIDSKLAATVELAGVRATITHSWDTTTVTAGSHTITVRVFDTSGNANSASVAVTVQR
ncbi:MAG: S8 family serine peptidase, partial [Planctomycetes bacterium]|nr:S8 family serine peptidase [Planctomycetota bacterium]